jgi:putative oxidoreductase
MNQERMTDTGLLLMRIMLAVVFIYHGAPKLFGGLEGFAGYLGSLGVPAPKVAAFLAAISEFGGGLVLLAGIGFRYALPPLFFTMMVASFVAHAGKFSVRDGGMEFALTLGVMVLGLILTGPGSYGLGGLLGRREDD